MPSRTFTYRLLAALLILGSAFLRILYLATDSALDLAPDEAHYWDWSRHLDWSYYSKGPLVAWLIRASCELFGSWSIALTGIEMLAVRLPAVLCGSLLLTSLYVLTVQIFRRDGLALAVVGAALTFPLLAVGSILMTIDAPFLCCWGWALVFGHSALFRNSTWSWIGAGLMVALGILAKHTMVLWIPSLGLFLLANPSFRRQLLRPGFWLMTLTAGLGCLPILVWNIQHDWVTLRHTGSHAGLESDRYIHGLGPLTYVGTQALVLMVYGFIVWCGAMFVHRPGRETCPQKSYLWWLSVPVFVFFLAFSLKNGGGEANWPVAAYVAGMVLAAGWLAEHLQAPSLWYRRGTWTCIAGTAAVGLALVAVLHDSTPVQPLLAQLAGPPTPERPCPLRSIDPTCRLRGWRTLAAEVDAIRAALRAKGIEPIVVSDSWMIPGELAFYCHGHPAVYSLGPAVGDRHSQYDLWRPNPLSDPQSFAGRTFIIVGWGDGLQTAFAYLDPPQRITHFENGYPVAEWQIRIGHGYRGFDKLPMKNPTY